MIQIPRVRVLWGRTVAATMLVALAGALALLFAASGAWGQTDEVRSQPPREQSGDTGTAAYRPDAADQKMLRKAEREGSVRVIVGLRTDFTPEGRLSRAQAEDQREAIQSAGEGLRTELSGTGYQTKREYETVPYIALKLTPEALRAVQNSPRTTTIQEDVAEPATLAESAPKVQAPTMWANNFTGAGKTIAILDTGVDRFHPFLGGRVVEEACYSDHSNCPNGQKTQTGTGSAAPCTYVASGCKHGTHVAGIAAGYGRDFSGVAPNAKIMAVQVFTRFAGADCANEAEDPCALSRPSDQVKGLERVYQLRNSYNFAAANMSIGGGQYTDNCDTDPRKAIIDNLRTAGIATVISSGNYGSRDSVTAPACVSSAVTVGNTTKQDVVASDSNMSPMVDLLAPGTNILSSVPGGGYEFLSGTSMAAPHVAGAWALLEEQDPDQNVLSNLFHLQFRSTPITDSRPGGTATSYRINIAEAAGVKPLNDAFSYTQWLPESGGSLKGINGAATRESGEPDHLPTDGSLGEKTVWYGWRAPASGQVTMNTCNSSFDTALVAYTGSTVGSLNRVASDDNGCGIFGNFGSKVTFNAVAGTDYRIAVAGVSGDARGEGTFTLDVHYVPPSNDYFANARVISGSRVAVSGTTLTATREAGEPDHYTTHLPDSDFWRGENSVWYSWTASFSGPVEMNTCQADALDRVLAVYTGSDLSSQSRVADDRYSCPDGAGSKVTFNATNGTTYRIAVADTFPSTGNPFTLRVIDRKSPTVSSTTPANNATGVARGSNVRANFSEAMQAGSINSNTFSLRMKGTTTSIGASVTYDSATNRATLNPKADLKAGATYIATITTNAKDLAGNQLDQDPNTAGNQPKVWNFKVRP
jgi:subtilisin